MSIFETIAKVKNEPINRRFNSELFADICDFLGFDEYDLTSKRRGYKDMLLRVIYYAIEFDGVAVSSFMNMLGRDRTGYWYYDHLLFTDPKIVSEVTNFCLKYGYKTNRRINLESF